jgi:hypothetical protein
MEKDGSHSEAASHGHGKTARKTSLAAEEEETESSARFVNYSVTLVTGARFIKYSVTIVTSIFPAEDCAEHRRFKAHLGLKVDFFVLAVDSYTRTSYTCT